MNQIALQEEWMGRLRHFLREEKNKKTAFGGLLQYLANGRRRLRYKTASYINSKRAHVDVRNIHILAKDVHCATSEIYANNAFYGHADVMKNYVQLRKQYQVKCVIDHGVYFGGYIWELEINFALPSVFTLSSYRKAILEKKPISIFLRLAQSLCMPIII